MTAETTSTRVPVDMLRPGLFVRELDRPWVETPFLFQGFRILADEEVQVLRAYCRVVVVDDERSAPAALASTRSELDAGSPPAADAAAEPLSEPQPAPTGRGGPKRPSERARRRSVGALFEDTANPDRKRFATLVQAAGAARRVAQGAVGEALERARQGGAIDVAGVQTAVEEVTERVIEDPTASLWLTRLRAHHEGTATHSVNTTVLALALGAYLGMDRRALRRLGTGALLHDIGKTTLPAELLQKAGPLTDAEAAEVRCHPQVGYELANASGQLHTASLEVIRLHHERWRGQGYPLGLSGETIPRNALIVGLADAYDAMTTRRPYAEAVAPDQALQALYAQADQTFSVELVEAFIRCLGIFPVGSVVELDNGARGVVVGAQAGGGLWPTVLMARTPDGEPLRKRLLVNLGAAPKRGDSGGGRRIARAIAAATSGIDVPRIVAEEFGHAA
jgi:putative nucleotidyltransferase with HDIG domain